jgi:hypothetical protein
MTTGPRFLFGDVNHGEVKPSGSFCRPQTAMAPEIEPAVARRSRRCNARRLFLWMAAALQAVPLLPVAISMIDLAS